MATYDIEALKADLPTAKELAQFVYDKTQIALDLVGKPKEDQYHAARNALEGKKVPSEFLTDENPYVDRRELIPEDELRVMPPRSEDLPQRIPKCITLGPPTCPTHLTHSQTRKSKSISGNTTAA